MIKTFESYTEWVECPIGYKFEIGERVKINPNSEYAYQVGGDGYGKIISEDHDTFNECWSVEWDDGDDGCVYWRKDLLVNKEKNDTTKIRWYNKGKLLSESSLEKIESKEICIDLNDYKEKYDNIFKDRYRNLETGEIFKLKDLFKGHFAIWITKSSLYDRTIKETKLEVIKGWDCDIEEIKNKNGKFIEIFPNKSQRNMNLRKIETSKGQDRMLARFSSKKSNLERMVISANEILMYNMSDYLNDIESKLFGTLGNITIRGTENRNGNIVTIQRVKSADVFYNTLCVMSDNKIKTFGNMWGYDSYYLDITKPIYSKRIQWFDAEFDPYGEEDWDD